MSVADERPLVLPTPPAPMTPVLLMAYLESIVEYHEVEDKAVMINGNPVVNATVVDGHIVLRTWCDELNLNPPCPDHIPVQHRDGKPPWCPVCRLTKLWKDPHTPKTTPE